MWSDQIDQILIVKRIIWHESGCSTNLSFVSGRFFHSLKLEHAFCDAVITGFDHSVTMGFTQAQLFDLMMQQQHAVFFLHIVQFLDKYKTLFFLNQSHDFVLSFRSTLPLAHQLGVEVWWVTFPGFPAFYHYKITNKIKN